MVNLIQYLPGNGKKKCLDWRIKLTYLDLEPNFKSEGLQINLIFKATIFQSLESYINAIRILF